MYSSHSLYSDVLLVSEHLTRVQIFLYVFNRNTYKIAFPETLEIVHCIFGTKINS